MAEPVVLGGPDAQRVAPLFRDRGCEVEVLPSPGATRLRELDLTGIRYRLIHVGAPDAEPGGSFERAHERIPAGDAEAVAERVRPRERPLLRCVAFAYKRGVPPDVTWVVDARFLANPYWDPALRPLSGLDPRVRRYVLDQPAAVELLDRLESDLRWAAPRYQREQLVAAIGCTGGRHRSVVIASELSRRLGDLPGFDVEFEALEGT